MYPRAFDYLAPPTISEVMAAVDERPDAKVMAGGMSLIPMMKLRLLSPRWVVDLGGVPGLAGIEDRGDHLHIGPLVRHHQIAESDLVRSFAPALSQAASWTGDVQVRNRGTLCGSIAHADVAADQPAAAIALGASVEVASVDGARTVGVGELIVDALTTSLAANEIIIGVRIPKQKGGGSAYAKLGRRGGTNDYAVVGVAAHLAGADGMIERAAVAITGAGTHPVSLPSVSAMLVGRPATDQVFAEAAASATGDFTVLADLFGSEEYKTAMAQVFTARALRGAAESAGI